jgi:hypothetical protein
MIRFIIISLIIILDSYNDFNENLTRPSLLLMNDIDLGIIMAELRIKNLEI